MKKILLILFCICVTPCELLLGAAADEGTLEDKRRKALIASPLYTYKFIDDLMVSKAPLSDTAAYTKWIKEHLTVFTTNLLQIVFEKETGEEALPPEGFNFSISTITRVFEYHINSVVIATEEGTGMAISKGGGVKIPTVEDLLCLSSD